MKKQSKIAMVLLWAAALIAVGLITSCNDTVEALTQEQLLENVTVDGVRAHLIAFQDIADKNNGNRIAGTSGYKASVDYVVDTLRASGYEPMLDEFPFQTLPIGTVQQTAPIQAKYESGIIWGSESGTVEGVVIPVDLALGKSDWPADPAETTSACNDSDFAGLDFSGDNDIALVQWGSCYIGTKITKAETAGAEAVLIMNQGSSPERMDQVIADTRLLANGLPSDIRIPVAGIKFDTGVILARARSQVQISVPEQALITQHNIIAELPGQDGSEVVMVGAHLDSLPGPGIEDNAAGCAAVLETAVQMSGMKPRRTIRFAWWGAEEQRQLGSAAYLQHLSQEELDKITMYLNFDLLAATNYGIFVYDGDGSDGFHDGPGPPGSAEIEEMFQHFYAERGVPTLGVNIGLNSDSLSFFYAGIPTGGVLTDPVPPRPKTDEEVALWGGTANAPYDAAYHSIKDNLENINEEALALNADAVAYATFQAAMHPEQ
jgi:Iap family predicted aminopeptidase